MKIALTYLARLGLVLTILPAVLYLFDAMALPTAKSIMIAGTALWLILSPYIQKLHEGEIE